jgi:hypothetical protein
MLRRGGVLVLLVAGLLVLAPVSSAVGKRARHRSPCGTFCRQAGGLGGSPGTPPCKVLNRRINVHQGLAAVMVRCTGGNTSRGAVAIYPHDIEHNSVSDGVPPGSYGGADLVCKPNQTVTLQIALSRKTRTLLQRKHTLRVDVLIELNTKPVVQATIRLNLPMAEVSG